MFVPRGFLAAVAVGVVRVDAAVRAVVVVLLAAVVPFLVAALGPFLLEVAVLGLATGGRFSVVGCGGCKNNTNKKKKRSIIWKV